MATTPEVSTITKIEQDFSWLKAHAVTALLTAVLLSGAAWGSVTVVEGIIAKHDAANNATEQKIADASAQVQQTLLAQLNQQAAENAAREAQYTAQLKSLTATLAASREQTKQQVATDATLDAQSAAARLVQQTKAAPTDATASGDSVVLTLPLTRKVVQDEDNFAQATADVNNLSQQLAIQQSRSMDALGQLDTANQVIAADKTELIARIDADNSACKVQLDQQAAKARKRTLWLTILSAIGGFAARSAL